jgi:hypothetical protein
MTEINERGDFTPHGEVGISLEDLERAVQVWSALQNRPTSVAEAATTFNCRPEIIREVVNENYWMYLSGPGEDPTQQTIEHEGCDE